MPGPRRVAGGVALILHLDPSAPRPLYRQVYDGLRESILAGRLRPGERLPATRTLAADLGVARNTVILAFEQLRTEGYLVGRRGAGTRVRRVLPDNLLSIRPASVGREVAAQGDGLAKGATLVRGAASAKAVPAVAGAAVTAHAPGDARQVAGGAHPEAASNPVRLSRQGAILAAAGAAMVRRGGKAPVPFRLGVPALDAFPARLWARLTARGATDWHAPTPQQSVLADFIGEGHYARHLRRVRALYAERQAILIAAAEAELMDHLSLAPDPAGLHLVGWLPHGVDDRAAAAAAAAEGALVYPISSYRLTPAPGTARGGLLLGYAGFDDAALREGVGKLCRALEALHHRMR